MTRILDFIFSLLAIFFLLPLLIPIMIILKFTGEGELFYSQMRIGRDQKEFALLKFATMLRNSPSIGTGTITVKDDPRILPVGRFLRKYKLNELPQLFNVLTGTMSLIGPRPQAKRNFDFFPEEAKPVIASVRPGLSGIGSIIFSDEENILDQENSEDFYADQIMPYKAELELFYVDQHGPKMYLQLIFSTLSVLLTGKSYLDLMHPSLPKPPKALKKWISL